MSTDVDSARSLKHKERPCVVVLFPQRAMGMCFDKLKMKEILQKSLWKHGFIAKIAQKKPRNSLKTMPKPWKMVSQSAFPMGEDFSGALVDFPWQTEVK